MRALLAAEEAFAKVNGGFYDAPPCLLDPASCVPAYEGPASFLDDPGLGRMGTRHGYVLSFHPGPVVPPETIAQGKVSPSSRTAFALVASPVTPGSRLFCADDTRLCYSPTGRMPHPPFAGRCPDPCEAVDSE
jgi:hypothetical protein